MDQAFPPAPAALSVVAMPRPGVAPRTEFGVYLERRMRERGFVDKAALSRAAGVTDSNLSRWMSGQTEPTVRELRKLAPHLDVRLGDLMVLAGLATASELGMKGSPPAPRAALPAQLQRIVSILLDPRVSDRHKQVLLDGVGRTVDMWEETREAPREPRMRKKAT